MSTAAFDIQMPDVLVRHLRAGAGLTQAQLAERIGTTQSAVSRWEKGHDEPRLSTITVIAAACGRRMTMQVEPDGVDRAQIQQHLAMTPKQRLAAASNVNRFLANVQRAN